MLLCARNNHNSQTLKQKTTMEQQRSINTMLGVIFLIAILAVVGIYFLIRDDISQYGTPPGNTGGQTGTTSTSTISTGGATSTSTVPAQANVAVRAAQLNLAERLAVRTETITTVRAEARSWPDACLGLPRAGEACAQVITPGFLVTLRSGTAEYRYRTNQDGTVIRQEAR